MLRCFVLVSIVLVLGLPNVLGAAVRARRICANYVQPNSMEVNAGALEEDESDGESDEAYEEDVIPSVALSNNISTTGNDVIVCAQNENFCYALWSFDPNQNVTFVRQGCWEILDKKPSCEQRECITEYNTKQNMKFLFCCCQGNLCNSRVTGKLIEERNKTTASNTANRPFRTKTLLTDPIVWSCLGIVFFVLLSLVVLLLLHSTPATKHEMAPLAPTTGPGYSSNMHNVDNLKLVSMIGQGKYGTVWKGIVNEESVAVKIFPAHHKQYFINEKDIYQLPLMKHKCLLEYLGCDERRTIDDRIEYLLVLSLAPMGCLQDWLTENTSTYTTFYKMASGIAQGLSHLHSELHQNGLNKPCVCHRDLNSRNILVKADLTCCLCDFGFAIKTFGPRYEHKGEIALAETKSISEVGTLRYLAPEVLEGAVNLRDCESALKQIDVYCLGLVLWELATRCREFYGQGIASVPPYLAPYETETGKHPTYEQMQVLVSRQKVRPKFSDDFGGGGAASALVKETCEDCWDHDSEARITAFCVVERLHDLCRSHVQIEATLCLSPYLNGSASKMKNVSPMCTHEASIITPPNQICTPESAGDTNRYNDRSTSAGGARNIQLKASRKEKYQFKLPGGKIKRNKLERKLQGWHGFVQKKLFRKIRLDHEEFSNSVHEDSRSAPKPSLANAKATPPVVRPNNLDLLPQRYFRPAVAPSPKKKTDCADVSSCHTATDSTTTGQQQQVANNNILLRADRVKNSAKLDKRLNLHSRLSLQPVPDVYTQQPAPVSRPRIVVSKSANTMMKLDDSELGGGVSSSEKQLKRQRSLDVFREVFNSRSSERLRDPSQRIKTPGDVPSSVRRSRASKTMSLFDDRMMMTWDGNSI